MKTIIIGEPNQCFACGYKFNNKRDKNLFLIRSVEIKPSGITYAGALSSDPEGITYEITEKQYPLCHTCLHTDGPEICTKHSRKEEGK